MLTPIDLHGTLLKEMEDPVPGQGGMSVIDLSDHSTVFSYDQQTPRLMASLTKIFTAGAALTTLGPTATVTTRVLSMSAPDENGVLEGDLHILGAGDPTLGSTSYVKTTFGAAGTSVQRIIDQLRSSGVREIRGRVIGDGSLFAAETGFTGPASALTYNQAKEEEPVLHAAQKFSEALEAAGITVSQPAAEGTVGSAGHLLASVESAPLREILLHAGHHSDNLVADTVAKVVAAREQSPASSRQAAASVQDYAARNGAEIEIVNGSGLGLKNYATPQTIAEYLARVKDADYASELIRLLPRAGHDGTLEDRMRNTLASETVRAKTGTLGRARSPLQNSLAGYIFGRRRTLAFCIIREKGNSRFASRVSIDRITDALAHYCDDGPITAPAPGGLSRLNRLAPAQWRTRMRPRAGFK